MVEIGKLYIEYECFLTLEWIVYIFQFLQRNTKHIRNMVYSQQKALLYVSNEY